MPNIEDISLNGADYHTIIRYKACQQDERGLLVSEPYIAIQIEKNGVISPWVDGDFIADHVNEYRAELMARLDKDFSPNEPIEEPEKVRAYEQETWAPQNYTAIRIDTYKPEGVVNWLLRMFGVK